jgi:hypothetical protein
VNRDAEREWIEQWRRASIALADQRARELAALSDDAALRATDAVLEVAASAAILPDRLSSSGLVRQQELFGRLRGR